MPRLTAGYVQVESHTFESGFILLCCAVAARYAVTWEFPTECRHGVAVRLLRPLQDASADVQLPAPKFTPQMTANAETAGLI